MILLALLGSLTKYYFILANELYFCEVLQHEKSDSVKIMMETYYMHTEKL